MVPTNCQGNLTKCWGVNCDGLASYPGGVAILLAALCYGNWDKLQLCGPVGSCANFNLATYHRTNHSQVKTLLEKLLALHSIS